MAALQNSGNADSRSLHEMQLHLRDSTKMNLFLIVLMCGVTIATDVLDNSTNNHSQNSSELENSKTYFFESGLVATSDLKMGEYIINIILKPIICISGFVFNIIGIYVLRKTPFQHSSYKYLLALMISDCGFLLCQILHIPLDIMKLTDEVYASYLASILDPVTTLYAEKAFAKVSSYIIIFLASERLFAISFPLRVRDMYLSRHAGKVNIAIFLVVFILYIPMIFERYFVYRFVTNNNVSMYVLERIIYNNATESFLVFHHYAIKGVIMLYTPPFLLLLLNLGILVQLARIRKRQREMFGADSKEQMRVTLTLIVISVFFLIVYTNMMILEILHSRDPHVFSLFRKQHNFMLLMGACISIGWSVNSANDFIIYIVFNDKFREMFNIMFCYRRRHKPRSTASPCQIYLSTVTHSCTLSRDTGST